MDIELISTCVSVLPVWLIELWRPYVLSAGWSLLRGLAWFIAALYLVMTISIWVATLRTLGLASVRYCPRMLRLSFRASLLRELFIALLLPMLVIPLLRATGIAAGFAAELPLGALTLIASLCLTLFIVPPTVIVFSSSTDAQLRWALGLKRFTGGRRVVSLLDIGYMTVAPRAGDLWSFMLRRSATATDVLRMSESDDWQSGVRELIEASPIIIFDTRVSTRALLFEACTVLTPASTHKAIFVSEDDGRCPLLERLLDEGHVDSRRLVSVVKESEVGQLLKRLVASGETLPKQGSFASTPLMIGQLAARRGLRQQSQLSSLLKGAQVNHRAGPFRPHDRTTLSSAMTPFWRLMAKAAVVQPLISTVFCLWWTMIPIAYKPLGFGGNALWSLLICNWIVCLIFFYMAHSLKEVSLAGDSLRVSDSAQAREIHLSRISHVTGPDWTTLRRTTLHFHDSSDKKIVFAGKLFSAGKSARELRRRLYAYAEKNVAAGMARE